MLELSNRTHLKQKRNLLAPNKILKYIYRCVVIVNTKIYLPKTPFLLPSHIEIHIQTYI